MVGLFEMWKKKFERDGGAWENQCHLMHFRLPPLGLGGVSEQLSKLCLAALSSVKLDLIDDFFAPPLAS
jgi:hypothetical protein